MHLQCSYLAFIFRLYLSILFNKRWNRKSLQTGRHSKGIEALVLIEIEAIAAIGTQAIVSIGMQDYFFQQLQSLLKKVLDIGTLLQNLLLNLFLL